MMTYGQNQRGMSILEVGVALAVLSIVSVVAVPGLQGWSQDYKLKSFARNVYSDMQNTRANAIKHNGSWEIEFNLNGYIIKDDDGSTVENIKFKDHSNDVKYGNPGEGDDYDTNPLVFNSRGMLNTAGFVYVTDARERVYYRIGAQFTTGTIRVEKWNGSDWE